MLSSLVCQWWETPHPILSSYQTRSPRLFWQRSKSPPMSTIFNFVNTCDFPLGCTGDRNSSADLSVRWMTTQYAPVTFAYGKPCAGCIDVVCAGSMLMPFAPLPPITRTTARSSLNLLILTFYWCLHVLYYCNNSLSF